MLRIYYLIITSNNPLSHRSLIYPLQKYLKLHSQLQVRTHMFVLRKVRPYQRAHKFYLLFFMSWHSTGMQPPIPQLQPQPLCLPLPQFQTHRWGMVQVLQIFSRLFTAGQVQHTHTRPHTQRCLHCALMKCAWPA